MTKQEVYISIKKSDLEQILSQLEYQAQKINELEQRLSKSSKNSSKPPSSDGYRKEVKNNRVKSGRKQGAQKGHKGSTLKMVETPDKIEIHRVSGICECGQDLLNLPKIKTSKRQVFDLPQKLLEVTEHHVEVKQCSCGKLHEAYCKYGNPVQYGSKLKSLGVYLNQYQYMPYNRIQEFMKDLLNINIGDGTLQKSNKDCYTNLHDTEMLIKSVLINGDVMHNDETGVRSENKTKWVHSASTPTHTHFAIHSKRGREAMDEIGILPEFSGVGIHDRYASYDKYSFEHAYCNAHILRDLKYLLENLNENWAKDMIELLTNANIAKKENRLGKKNVEKFKSRYDKILAQAIKSEKEKPEIKPVLKKRGRLPTSKSLRMINMFAGHKTEVLRFLDKQEVPFDNNLAERDLRMVKLKEKISGCFRSGHGADTFFRIRGYISTARKQGHDIFNAIQLALEGKPLNLVVAEQ